MPRAKRSDCAESEKSSENVKPVKTEKGPMQNAKFCETVATGTVDVRANLKKTLKLVTDGEKCFTSTGGTSVCRTLQKRKATEQEVLEQTNSKFKKHKSIPTVSSDDENNQQSKRSSKQAAYSRVTRTLRQQSVKLEKSVGTGSFTSKPEQKVSRKKKNDLKKTSRPSVQETEDICNTDLVDMKPKVNEEREPAGTLGNKGSRKLVGAHCSIAGGLHNAVKEAVSIGGQAFGLFLRSQRSWTSKPLEPEAADKFKAACKEHGFPPNSILPHGSYLMNCGSPNEETLKKSRKALLEELNRCETLGLTLYNFHPGSTCGEISVEECLDKIADSINRAHQQTKYTVTVLENMSCQGNTVGGRFEELKGIIDRVKDKSRIGVCLDTCHAFAAGYDLASKKGFEKLVSDFDSIVGFQYLRAMHLNDSKGAVGCHLDRHENIGKGQIGIDGFRRVMEEPRFDGIPMILETPVGDYSKEIKALNNLI